MGNLRFDGQGITLTILLIGVFRFIINEIPQSVSQLIITKNSESKLNV